MVKKRLHIKIRGKVQGVFFRDHTVEFAKELGLKGWVKNNSDGSVEIIFEGKEDKLHDALLFCYKGKGEAMVKEVEKKWKEYKGEFKKFERLN